MGIKRAYLDSTGFVNCIVSSYYNNSTLMHNTVFYFPDCFSLLPDHQGYHCRVSKHYRVPLVHKDQDCSPYNTWKGKLSTYRKLILGTYIHLFTLTTTGAYGN